MAKKKNRKSKAPKPDVTQDSGFDLSAPTQKIESQADAPGLEAAETQARAYACPALLLLGHAA